MKKNVWLTLNLLVMVFNGFSQVVDFKVQEVHEKACFNKMGLDSINSFIGEESLLQNVFNTLPGKYTIYQLTRSVTKKGIKKDDDGTSSTTELLMLGVEKGVIKEVYFFPLNWREPPLKGVLYYSTPNLKLTESIKVSELNLKPYLQDFVYQYEIKEGIVQIK
jgi:hypothetical protein